MRNRFGPARAVKTFWLASWLAGWASICYAATLQQDILDIDWVSFLLAAAAGLFGGLGRTIIALMWPKSLVANTKLVLAKDLAVSIIAGVIVFVVIAGWNEVALTFFDWPEIKGNLRLLLLGAAGYAPRWAFGKIDQMATAVVTRAQRTIGGSDDSISEVAALEPKK